MYDIVADVRRWSAEGRQVWLARVVDTRGISSRDRAAVVAYTEGQPLAGSLFSGAADPSLPQLLSSGAGVHTLTITEAAAGSVGLSCGGSARLLVQPADSVPEAGWQQLATSRPVCVVTDLETLHTRAYLPADLPRPARGELADIARVLHAGVSQTQLLGTDLVSAFWPTPNVLVVGDGQIADAIVANVALLGWHTRTGDTVPDQLDAADNVIVLSHDLEISGSALRTALTSDAGYIGALGSRHTQAARAQWLSEHGVAEQAISRIHGPAGLDIGSRTPAEIAVSIVAEMIAARR